jgi:Cdc6-like AAA superfamily ATPase
MDEIRADDTFMPSQHIADKDRFCGRKEQLKRALKALARAGSSIVVYGDRGVGKSSFVEMIKLIAQDQAQLVYDFNFKHLLPKQHGFQYKVVSLECDAETDTSEKVLQRLLTSPQGFGDLVSSRMQAVHETTKSGLGFSVIPKILSMSGSSERKIDHKAIPEDSVAETFRNVLHFVCKNILRDREKLLIVIDEFDLVTDTRLIASLIKTCSRDNTKFLIAGVAESYQDLIKEHPSIHRQLDQGTIGLRPMESNEVEAIFKLAEHLNKGLISFHGELVRDVHEKSGGYPGYVHRLGQIALDEFVKTPGREHKGTISKQHLSRGLQDYARWDPTCEKNYLDLVNDDPSREMMLHQLSRQVPRVIHQDQVFKACKKRGVADPKRVLAQLLTFKTPVIVERKDRDTVTFKDQMFRAFAANRPPTLLQDHEFYGVIVPHTEAQLESEDVDTP